MTILERANNIKTKLISLQVIKTGTEETKSLDGLKQDLSAISVRFKTLTDRVKLFKTEGINFSPVGRVIETKDLVTKMSNRLREQPKLATLTQGKNWTTLISSLNALESEVSSMQKIDWQNYFSDNYFAGAAPDKRSSELTLTPENQTLLTQYKLLYSRLVVYRTSFPSTPQMFTDLREASNELQKIEFDENIPESVRTFFNATNAGGAGLSLLTNEVVEWLRAKDRLNNYIVRARLN